MGKQTPLAEHLKVKLHVQKKSTIKAPGSKSIFCSLKKEKLTKTHRLQKAKVVGGLKNSSIFWRVKELKR